MLSVEQRQQLVNTFEAEARHAANLRARATGGIDQAIAALLEAERLRVDFYSVLNSCTDWQVA